MLFSLPFMQRQMAGWTADALSGILHTEVRVGSVSIGFINRLVIDDVCIEDREGKQMLKVARMAVSIDLLSLLRGEIDVSSAQLFGLNAGLYRNTPEAEPNYRFVLDAFKPGEKNSPGRTMDIRINSFIMRHANITYDVMSEEPTPDKFNTSHISLHDVGMKVVLKAFTEDSLNLAIRRFNAEDICSGIGIKDFCMKLEANAQSCVVPVFELSMSNSVVRLDTVFVDYSNYKKNGAYSYKTALHNSRIALSDLKGFLPLLSGCDRDLYVDAGITGNSNGVYADSVCLHTDDEGFSLNMDAKMEFMRTKETAVNFDVRDLRISESETTDFFLETLEQHDVREMLHRIGYVGFSGTLSKRGDFMGVDGHVATGAGDMDIECLSKAMRTFSGYIDSRGIDLSLIADNENLGMSAFHFDAEALCMDKASPEGAVSGTIDELEYQGYRYSGISLDAKYRKGMIGGRMSVDDANLKLSMDGHCLLSEHDADYDISLEVREFCPHALNLTGGFADEKFDFNLSVDLNGKNPDFATGMVAVDSVVMYSSDNVYALDKLVVSAELSDDGERHLLVSGDMIEANVYGNVAFSDILNSVRNQYAAYLPSVIDGGAKSDAYFDFDIELYESEFVRHLLDVDCVLERPVHISGNVNSARNAMGLILDAPRVIYEGTRYDDMRLQCDNVREQSNVSFSVLRRRLEEATKFTIDANAGNDCLSARVWWKNSTEHSINGEISAVTTFADSAGCLKTNVDLLQSELLINDTVWHVHPAHIALYNKEIHCNNIKIENKNQYIKVNGIVSDNIADTIVADLNDLQLEYFLDLINFHSVDFKGRASGRAVLRNIYGKPDVKACLRVEDFQLQGGRLGTADIGVCWDDTVNGIAINAHITDMDEKGGKPEFRVTDVNGYVSPGNNDINLLINVNNTNAGFLNGFLGGIFEDIEGCTNGYLRVVGPLNDINLVGDIVPDISMRLRATNVVYNICDDTIRLRPNKFVFDNIGIYDKKKNRGVVNGTVEHDNLKNFSYKFNIGMDNLICYDERDFNSDKFYATVYANGNMQISGADGHPLYINANVTPVKGSVFAYDAASPDVVLSSNFVEFRDRKDKEYAVPEKETEAADKEFVTFGKYNGEQWGGSEQMLSDAKASESVGSKDEYEYEGDIFMDLSISLTPDCEIKLRMDNTEDGYINTFGNASLRASYHNKGSFQLFGNYNITSGRYRLFLQELIFRDLVIQNGSQVKFNGNPFDANLHLICHHTLSSVPLSDLTASTAYIQNNKVKVVCILDITGQLGNMNFKFNIDLPTVNDETKQLVYSMISSDEEMNMQIIYLLGVGRFYTNEFARANGDANSSQAINSLISSTLSGQINQMLSNMMGENRKWNFGAGFTTGEHGWEDIDVEGMLSGSLLNDRLLINGNFGYRDNALTQTSNFVGDFDVRWRITENGHTYIKAYNQMNDRYFTKATLNTQGIGISYQRSFESWRNLMKWKKREKEIKSAELKTDSVK